MYASPFVKEITDDFFVKKRNLQILIKKNPLSLEVPIKVKEINILYDLIINIYEWAPPSGKKYKLLVRNTLVGK